MLDQFISGRRTLHSFIRCSTPEQALKTTERRQVEKGRRYASENDWNFSDRYRALGISAFRGKQRRVGGLKVFFDEVAAAVIAKKDGIYVENFDRLSREPTIDALDLFRQIIRMGMTLVVRDQPYTEDILRREKWRWHEIVAEFNRANEESERKREGVRAANEINRSNAAQKKRALHGRNCPPWLLPVKTAPHDPVEWYDGPGDDGTAYKKVQNRVDVLHRILRMALDGFGVRKIAAMLNRDDVPDWSRQAVKNPSRKPQWRGDYIARILKNPALIGACQPHKLNEEGIAVREGAPIEGHYPRIITDKEFEAIRDGLQIRRLLGKGIGARDFPNLVTGLCQCWVCKGRVRWTERPTTKNGKIYRKSYLVCVNSQSGGCENNTPFPYRALEKMLLDYPRLSDAIAAMIVRQPDTTEQQITDVENQLAQVKRERERLITKIITEDDDDAIAQAKHRQLREKERRLDTEIAELRRMRRLRQDESDEDWRRRFAEKKAEVTSNDPDIRYAARAALANQYRQRIYRVWLDRPRTYLSSEFEMVPPGKKSRRKSLVRASQVRIAIAGYENGVIEITLAVPAYSRSLDGKCTITFIQSSGKIGWITAQTEADMLERVEFYEAMGGLPDAAD